MQGKRPGTELEVIVAIYDTSKGSSMSLPSLGSVFGSGAHPGTGRLWYHVLYSPQILNNVNKHHQRVSAGMSTSSKLPYSAKFSRVLNFVNFQLFVKIFQQTFLISGMVFMLQLHEC